MITYVQDGRYRTKSVVITRKVNGVVVNGDGFPVTVSLLSAFADQPAVTEAQLMAMTDGVFNQRVIAFKAYILATYHFLVEDDFQNEASGTDAVLCPVNTVMHYTVTSCLAGYAALDTTIAPLIPSQRYVDPSVIDPGTGQPVFYIYDNNIGTALAQNPIGGNLQLVVGESGCPV